jgi:hypothetical protein
MHTITRDPDSGVVDQDCLPLSPEKVFDEVASHIKCGLTFMGQPPSYWRELIADHAQALADEADPDEYEFWGIRYMEKP